MPHRPEGKGPVPTLPGGVSTSAAYTPPLVTRSAATGIMTSDSLSTFKKKLTANTEDGSHPSGVVTPVVKSMGGLAWLSTSNKSTDSMDRSLVTMTTSDDNRSIATLATEDEREVTASALLMVAKVAEREHQQHYLKGIAIEGANESRSTPGVVLPADSSSASTCSASTVPLKKRAKKLNIMQKLEFQACIGKDVCHVSPVSHDSDNPSSTVNRIHSYDSKDLSSTSLPSPNSGSTTEVLDSSKVNITSQIGLEPQVQITHFPTVLHQILADEELTFSDNSPIIHWLEDGETWKVENWNALRRHVLPKHFSDLRDEHGSACGTIDAFLHNIDAWGFEEIKNGPYAGAYRHNLFIRGAQKLCIKMRFNSDLNEKLSKTISSSRSTSDDTEQVMLQVPMLALVDSKIKQTLSPNKRPRNECSLMGHGFLHWPYSNKTSLGMGWGEARAQDRDPSHNYTPGIRPSVVVNGNNSYIDPRIQPMSFPASNSMAMQRNGYQYKPPKVRSGRGALRGIASVTPKIHSAMETPLSVTPSFRHGFPVSNRGKRSRKSTACRNPVSNYVKVKPGSTNPLVMANKKVMPSVGAIDQIT